MDAKFTAAVKNVIISVWRWRLKPRSLLEIYGGVCVKGPWGLESGIWPGHKSLRPGRDVQQIFFKYIYNEKSLARLSGEELYIINIRPWKFDVCDSVCIPMKCAAEFKRRIEICKCRQSSQGNIATYTCRINSTALWGCCYWLGKQFWSPANL